MTLRRTLLPGLVALSLAVPARADAQIGPLLEWINSLSGPGLLRLGPEVVVARVDDRNRVAVAPLFVVAVDERDNAQTEAADIGAFSVQAMFESTLLGAGGPVELRSRLGFEVHWFWGEFDTFAAPSFPLLVALHVPVDGWAIHIGTGFNVFSFPDDAFDPFDVGVETDGFDAGWTVQLGVRFGRFTLF